MQMGYEMPESQYMLDEHHVAERGTRRARTAFRVGSAAAALAGVLAIVGVLRSSSSGAAAATATGSATAAAAVVSTSAAPPIMQPSPGNVVESVVPTGRAAIGMMKAASVAAASGTTELTQAKESTEVFDENDRFIMHSFDTFKSMSSFLPGVAGLWGVPMWAFYVNRGQAIATFGVQNKGGGILLFQTADKAYQVTPYVGFRTLLKGKRADGSSFEAQPFLPSSDAKATHPARRDMYIGNNELEIEESDPTTGIRTNVLYFNAPNEDFPVFVRRVTYTNEGTDAVELDIVDGLAKLEPEGSLDKLGPDKQIITIGRTLEGWMHVYNFEDDHTSPFFHFVTAPADTADVALIKDGHFAMAFVEDDANVDASTGTHELLPMICDQQVIFGTDTTLTVPRKFFANATSPKGTPLSELLKQPQSTTSRTPSAFAAVSLSLKPGESKTLSVVYGHAPDVDTLKATVVPKIKAKGYVSGKHAEARALAATLTERVSMSSAVPQLDQYTKQNYLDNVLRGGMPVQIGETGQSVEQGGAKIFHAFSRIHGDLERDYNNFVIEPSYWSQGPGNFRDVNQNRRCDVLQLPSVYDFNVRQFLSYVQADGYSQLTVATAFFKISSPAAVDAVAAQATASGPSRDALKKLLAAPFRPGQLFNDLKKAAIEVTVNREKLLELVTKDADQVPAGQYPQTQNGFWTDHFTYHLDLVHNFLAVFPDRKAALLFDSEPIPFYMAPSKCVNRTEKNMLVAEGKVRQFDAVLNSTAKIAQLSLIYSDKSYVGEVGIVDPAGGTWQRTSAGTTMKVSIAAKLATLALTKFSILDPLSMGVEMEAGKPGWNDAMNGLPALFGSEMPSSYELYEIVRFLGAAMDEVPGRSVSLPEEVSALLEAVDAQLAKVASGAITDFAYWDGVHDALEAYRTATEATFSGRFVSWAAPKLGKASGVLGRMQARMEVGQERALAYKQDGVVPTYFKFTATKYSLTGKTSSRGFPTVKVEALEPSVLPLFLEGPTRQLKTLTKLSDMRAVYEAVSTSHLKDDELNMYKVSASLANEPLEIGRMKAFDAGWLENESVWLHMSYKWYLELLRAGLYAEFFKEMKAGVVAFMDPEVFGRSPLEAASFIVSSAFPDKSLHGSGFLARLSGSTAEFLSMWNHMMVGVAPFTLGGASGQSLQLKLEPAIASWLWRPDGTLSFRFLGAIDVTYVLPSKKDSWEATIQGYVLEGRNGEKVTVDGAVVPSPIAEDVRALKYSKMTVTLA